MNISRAMCGGLALAVLYSSSVYSQAVEIYEYDDLGRLTWVATDFGDEVEYEYDPVGNRTQQTVYYLENRIPIDNIPTLGFGRNLISLENWPVDTAPSGFAVLADWGSSASFSNETRWTRVDGPGSTSTITAMESGQTEADANGGGASKTNEFAIDPTKGYEFTLYFKKFDLNYQYIYFGTSLGGMVKYASSTSVHNNPYFLSFSPASQSSLLDANKWYKIVTYVLPEGFPLQDNADWGGIYEVDSGARIASVVNFRWNEDRPVDQAYARFFNYYDESEQIYTTYFYQPSVRVTNITYTPEVPKLSITHSNALEGENISFYVNLDQATTVDVKVDYETMDGTASDSEDYTATSGTLVIPEGQTSGTITVATTEDTTYEANETLKIVLSSPVRATLSETSEYAAINDDDAGPSFAINNGTVSEGGSLTFTVTKTGSTVLSHSVSYATADNTAIAGSDYTTASGTLTFTSGQDSKTIQVNTIEDGSYESNETFYVNLSSATNGATISDSQGVGTITNDDNVAPVANNDSVTAIQASQVTVNVVSNDTDANGDSLTVTSVSADYCTIYSSTSLDCSAGPTGTRTFTYTISDGFGGTDTGTVTLTVTGGGGGPLD